MKNDTDSHYYKFLNKDVFAMDTVYSKSVIDEASASSFYEFLRDNVDWIDGVRTRYGGFTRKAKPIDPTSQDIVTQVIIQLIGNVTNILGYTHVPVVGIYLNYYRDGNDYTPNHSHKDMRQIIISLGATRTLTIGNDAYKLSNGDVIQFGSSVHGVPKDHNCKDGRISIALFTLKI